MEDILAVAVVLVIIGSVLAIGRIVYISRKKAKQREQDRLATLNEIKTRYREKLSSPSPSDYASAMSTPKPKPAMKKANVTPSYASTPMTSTSSTSTAVADDNFFTGVMAGYVVNSLVDSLTHKSEPSVGVTKTESSWGFDDSDSRKSISDSMSSSWSSDSSSSSDSWSSSSDSGPSSDW